MVTMRYCDTLFKIPGAACRGLVDVDRPNGRVGKTFFQLDEDMPRDALGARIIPELGIVVEV